MTTVHITSGGF